jgi:hypothetical protein
MTDDRPRALEPDAAGDLPLAELVKTAADAVEAGQPADYAPATGRVLDDSQTDQVWLGDGTEWRDITHTVGMDLAGLPGVQVVRSADDLPDANGGVRQLEAGTTYLFADFVTDPATLELAPSPGSPLIGWHGGQSGYIHTGGGTVIQGTDAPVFMRNASFSGPGATMFDLTATTGVEVLVESCSFADPANLGNLASLGTIDGYRVPSFKGCNFEDFNAGLTFTGTSDKIFLSECPLRTVTASGVTILEFDADFETEVVDITDCYVKDVQSDTEVIRVDPGATITEIFQYRGVTHEETVSAANILTGAASVAGRDYRVTDSFPLENSKGYIDYTLGTEATTTINTQAGSKTDTAAYERVAGNTTELTSARFDHADNLVTYRGKRARILELTATLSMGTGTSDTVAAAWFQNGSIVPGTPTRVQMNQQGGGVAKSLTITGIESNAATGDEFDVRVANLGSTTDIDVGELTAKLTT